MSLALTGLSGLGGIVNVGGGSPPVSGVVFDFAATFSFGDDGDPMTATMWNNGIVGAEWGNDWLAYKNGEAGANDLTFLRDHGVKLPFDLNANGTTVSRDAVRGYRFDLTGNPISFDMWRLPFSAGVTEAVLVYFFKTNTVLNGGPFYNDTFVFTCGDYFVPQLRHNNSGDEFTMTAHSDEGTADTVVVSGNTWHCVVARYNDTDGFGEFFVQACSVVGGALVLWSILGTGRIALSVGGDLLALDSKTWLPQVGIEPSGTIDLIGPFFEKTTAAFPPVNYPLTVPPPTVIATQSDESEITVSVSGAATDYVGEYRVSDDDGETFGAWTSLFGPVHDTDGYAYAHTGLTDTYVYEYRVRSYIGTAFSDYGTDSETVENTPPDEGGENYHTAVAALSPVLYWRLGEAVAAEGEEEDPFNAEDSSGNDRVGVYHGPTRGVSGLVPGNADKAATFDGNDWVDIPSETALQITGDITVCAIAKPSVVAQSFNTVFCKGVDGSNRPYELGTTSADKWRAVFWTSGGAIVLTSTTTISTGRVDHLLMTKVGGTAKLYVNGAEEASTSVGSLITEAGYFSVGRLGSVDSNYFRGIIDEVFILNAGMSGAEVTALFDASGL